MKKINKTAFVVGSSLVAGFGSTAILADNTPNPFEFSELSSGYMNIAQAAAENAAMKMKDGSCGEGKCGEGKCGDKKDAAEKKAKEGKCGEGKCGDKKDMNKAKEGKCGEGKCGDKK